jgi:hypothetical protein
MILSRISGSTPAVSPKITGLGGGTAEFLMSAAFFSIHTFARSALG